MIQIVHAENSEEITSLLDGTQRLITRVPMNRLVGMFKWLKALIADFDDTLTTRSQWIVVAQLMSQEMRERDNAARDWYFSISRTRHDNGTPAMDDPDWWIGNVHTGNIQAIEAAWVSQAISSFHESGVSLAQIENTASAIQPREGALQLLRMFERRAVISMGIEQLILRWLRDNEVLSLVAANRLTLDANGVVNGVHLNMLIGESKRIASERFRNMIQEKPERVMAIGDSVIDAAMFHPSGCNILIFPPSQIGRRIELSRRNDLSMLLGNVTAILVSDSLEPLVDLIKKHRNAGCLTD